MRVRYFCLRCGVEFLGDFHPHNEYTGYEQGGPIEPGEGPILGEAARPAVCSDCVPLLTPAQAATWSGRPAR